MEDTARAETSLSRIAEIEYTREAEETLYIEIDGAAVNTRVEDENGSTWRENKTAMVFSDKHMIKRKDEGNIITQKEYTPLIGSSEDFKKYVLDIALRAGYGKVQNVVVIADGAAWVSRCGSRKQVYALDTQYVSGNIPRCNTNTGFIPFERKYIYLCKILIW